MGESLPLATIHAAVLEFLRGRDDAAVFGAQAVNAYVDKPRMTEDVDILSPRAEELADELRAFLNKKFHIAAHVRSVKGGVGYRIYQVRKPKNRHLVDLRPVSALPAIQRVDEIPVLTPVELISSKVLSMIARGTTLEGAQDRIDLGRLLLTFPELKVETGPVAETLRAAAAPKEVLAAWKEVVAQEIRAQDEDEGY